MYQSQLRPNLFQFSVEQAQTKGYDTKLITIEVGSRGVPHLPGFEDLASDLGLQRKQLARLLEDCAKLALAGSFSIWCSRNRKP